MPVVKAPTYPDKVTGKEIIIGIEARGTIDKPKPGESPPFETARTYQISTVSDPEDPLNRKRVQLQYPYVKRINPGTGPQLVRQQVLADGVAAWQALGPEEKEIWNAKRRKEYLVKADHPAIFKARSGYHIFLQDYLNKH